MTARETPNRPEPDRPEDASPPGEEAAGIDTNEQGGRLIENVMLFARTLRAAGLPLGPGRVLEGIAAVQAVGIARRTDLYWALHAVFVTRHEQTPLFDQAFHVFWRNPRLLERLTRLILPEVRPELDQSARQKELSRRLAEAMQAEMPDTRPERESEAEDEIDLDAALTWSDQETLQTKDFEMMSRDEVAAAKRAIAALRLPVNRVRTRRYRPTRGGGRPDPRRTLQAALRGGGDAVSLKYKRQRTRTPALVVICDISGSMAQYARLVLHFMHTLTNDRDRVHSFVFGTRLSNISRSLRDRDVDAALDKVGESVTDWEGGTRIGHCLHTFNRDWSRRVLAQGAVVLLITDGLDRDNAAGLAREMERLHKSSRRLIWLNPLLRYAGYAPKSQGARAMIRHVDELRTIHNLSSLAQLAEALRAPGPQGREGVEPWLKRLPET